MEEQNKPAPQQKQGKQSRTSYLLVIPPKKGEGNIF